jgi:uncharacterized membrane protein (UPF0127 family)
LEEAGRLDGKRRVAEGLGTATGATAMPPVARRLLSCLMLTLAGCASAGGSWVELAGHRYGVEVADDETERERGLMFRDELAADRGMLFIHDRQEPQSYWMKNTRIPLDILYFDNARKLVSQQRDVPPCTLGDACPPYPSNAPARYVLELNAGEAARLSLRDGVELRFGPGITPAP